MFHHVSNMGSTVCILRGFSCVTGYFHSDPAIEGERTGDLTLYLLPFNGMSCLGGVRPNWGTGAEENRLKHDTWQLGVLFMEVSKIAHPK